MSQVLVKKKAATKPKAKATEDVVDTAPVDTSKVLKKIDVLLQKKKAKKRRCFCGIEVGVESHQCSFLLGLNIEELKQIRKEKNCTC